MAAPGGEISRPKPSSADHPAWMVASLRGGGPAGDPLGIESIQATRFELVFRNRRDLARKSSARSGTRGPGAAECPAIAPSRGGRWEDRLVVAPSHSHRP